MHVISFLKATLNTIPNDKRFIHAGGFNAMTKKKQNSSDGVPRAKPHLPAGSVF